MLFTISSRDLPTKGRLCLAMHFIGKTKAWRKWDREPFKRKHLISIQIYFFGTARVFAVKPRDRSFKAVIISANAPPLNDNYAAWFHIGQKTNESNDGLFWSSDGPLFDEWKLYEICVVTNLTNGTHDLVSRFNILKTGNSNFRGNACIRQRKRRGWIISSGSGLVQLAPF